MVKQRVTAVDVYSIANELNLLLKGSKLINIYDSSYKDFVFKFSSHESKMFIQLEMGLKFFKTSCTNASSRAPNAFNMRLRKHLRNSHCISVEQLGVDRVIVLTLSNKLRVIIELYGRGNLAIVDESDVILLAWRKYEDKQNIYNVLVGQKYPFEAYKTKIRSDCDVDSSMIKDPITDIDQAVLSTFINYKYPLFTNQICDRIVKKLLSNSDMSTSVQSQIQTIGDSIVAQINEHKGYLSYDIADSSKQYNVFTPCVYEILDKTYEEFSSFNACLDRFYSVLVQTRNEKQATSEKDALLHKIVKIERDQQNRLDNLLRESEDFKDNAERASQHIDFVNQVISMIKRLIESKTKWEDLKSEIELSALKGHPIASYIADIDFAKSKINVLLPSSDFDKDFSSGNDVQYDSEGSELKCITLDYSVSGYENVSRMFKKSRLAYEKYEKTKVACEKVLKKARKVVDKELMKTSLAPIKNIMVQQKTFWFNKFHWFITSENFLVIAGRDISQNDLLYKKYLMSGDLFFHADTHGASATLLKVGKQDSSIVGEKSLSEAATFAVCHSSAWKQNTCVNAYWVHANQVSKTPVSGEFLPAGSFVIRGTKNFIAVNKLELGVSLAYIIDDNSNDSSDDDDVQYAVNHIDDAKVRQSCTSSVHFADVLQPVQAVNELTVKRLSIDLTSGEKFSSNVDATEPARLPVLTSSSKNVAASSFASRRYLRSMGSDIDRVNLAIDYSSSDEDTSLSDFPLSSVRFGSCEVVIPPPLIPQVDFDNNVELVTISEVDEIKSEKRNSVDIELIDVQKVHEKISQYVGSNGKTVFELNAKVQPGSADELPAPSNSDIGMKTAKELLQDARLEEQLLSDNKLMDGLSSDVDDASASMSVPRFSITSVTPPLEQNRRRSSAALAPLKHRSNFNNDWFILSDRPRASIDGGPLPCGYISSDELPNVKDLLACQDSDDNIKLPAAPAKLADCISSGVLMSNDRSSYTTRSSTNESSQQSKQSKKCGRRGKLKKLSCNIGEQDDNMLSDSEQEYVNKLLGLKPKKSHERSVGQTVASSAGSNVNSKLAEIIKNQAKRKEQQQKILSSRVIGTKTDEEAALAESLAKRLKDISKITFNYSDKVCGIMYYVAPYSNIRSREFQARIIPEKQKTGASANLIVTAFTKKAASLYGADSSLTYMLRQYRIDNLITVLPSNLKVIVEGGAQLLKKADQDKKALKKLAKKAKKV